jgi:nitrite reductase/ring-hydroxylating ferredoxin subunit
MAFVRLFPLSAVPPGRTHFIIAGNIPVIVANYQGEIHAFHGLCPHRHNPLEGATLWDNLLDCPYHHFQYDVLTGENYFPKNVYPEDLPLLRLQLRPLRRYPAEVRGDDIWVDLE